MQTDADRNLSDLREALKQALGSGPEAHRARARAKELLGLDDLNFSYFFCLYQAKKGGAKARSVRIHENGKGNAFPTDLAPAEMLKHLRQVEYRELASSPERYDETARGVALWVKKMQAGSGSSMTRTTYLARKRGLRPEQVRIGAKGTDLYLGVHGSREISLAEAQIVQSLRDLERGEVGEVIFHDIMSSETDESLRQLWAQPAVGDGGRSYAELVRATPGLSRFGASFQAFLPTLDEQGELSFNRRAPGGHGLFAVDALRAAFDEKLRPRTEKPLVAAISNGEDLSGTPDRFMLGYVVKKRVPIALVTTERTPVDAKGGLLALLRDDDGSVSLTVVETAQAKEAGQEKLFAGLKGAMNTNMALFNYDVLAPLLAKEVAEIGEDEFLRVIAPDLISNVKEQKDADGVSRRYQQLEGTMGTVIMNLDRYWRRKHGQPLVHLIEVDRARRTVFFSPIKSAFDYFMQFHSDRFTVDARNMRLKNERPGELPEITLRDPASGDRFWADVQNVLESFEGASVKDLDSLELEGQVSLRGVRLAGRVRIVNRTGKPVDLSARRELRDETVEL